ncbi:uncharacterized protein [Rutidosis leptorrhynchoides]|uniref:uncharacterized protein n=1 Tax=Rutidosis leptorrhynchoides TaxID=125765 RepID=UPI003A98CEF5
MPGPFNFYVLITKDNFTQNSLRISTEFDEEQMKQIQSNDNMILMVSDNKNWCMGWQISTDGHLLLQNGWPEFAKHYRIKIGQLLQFDHIHGSSNFHIRIYGENTHEITTFPSINSSHLEQEIDQPVLQTNSNVQETQGGAQSSENRFCSVKISESYSKFRDLYLPASFFRKYMTGENNHGDCMFQTPDGQKWGPIQFKEKTASGGRLSGVKLKEFFNDVHLGVGDVCV